MAGLDTLVQAFAEDPKSASPQEKPPWNVMKDAVGYAACLLDIADTDLRSMPPLEREIIQSMCLIVSKLAHELAKETEESARSTATTWQRRAVEHHQQANELMMPMAKASSEGTVNSNQQQAALVSSLPCKNILVGAMQVCAMVHDVGEALGGDLHKELGFDLFASSWQPRSTRKAPRTPVAAMASCVEFALRQAHVDGREIERVNRIWGRAS
jgi:hypothetical protein